MKFYSSVVACFLFFLFLTGTVSGESSTPQTILIETYQADVTGDGLFEEINLKGTPFSPDAAYYHNIWAEIINPSNDKRWKINYGGGYEPTIEFVDLNHDQINDMLYQSPTGGSGGLYHSDLHTLANGNLVEIPLPEQPYVTGNFVDNFAVELQISPHEKPIHIDLQDRAQMYIDLEIYNEQGKLINPRSIIIDPIAFFEVVRISESKGFGLISYKQISAAYHADRIGTIESLWYYEDGKWIILQTDWVE